MLAWFSFSAETATLPETFLPRLSELLSSPLKVVFRTEKQFTIYRWKKEWPAVEGPLRKQVNQTSFWHKATKGASWSEDSTERSALQSAEWEIQFILSVFIMETCNNMNISFSENNWQLTRGGLLVCMLNLKSKCLFKFKKLLNSKMDEVNSNVTIPILHQAVNTWLLVKSNNVNTLILAGWDGLLYFDISLFLVLICDLQHQFYKSRIPSDTSR